jgi:anhydro-N-acetylmuramic acid kinase
MNVIGIMNGTSIDGVDFVFTKITKKTVKYIDQISVLFPKELKLKLRKCSADEMTTYSLADLHHELGRFYAHAFKLIKNSKKWKPELIGLHGQTVFHGPPSATLQIGEPTYLKNEAQCPVAFDFRVADLAVGGQGAPIASLFHQNVLAKYFIGSELAVQNLGGIGNVTYIDKKGKVQLAFDTGPANMLMDLFMQQFKNKNFDENGKLAASGIPNLQIVDQLLKHSYFQKTPPKSCGKEEFGAKYLNEFIKKTSNLSKPDQLATLVELTAKSITTSYTWFLPKSPKVVILCGGGAKNSYLKFRIQYSLPNVKIVNSTEVGWPVEAIEGGAFALLAACKLWNSPSNLPKTTGATKSVCLGKWA